MKITIKKCFSIPDWLYIATYKNEILSGTTKTRKDAIKEALAACLVHAYIANNPATNNSLTDLGGQ